MTLTEIIKIASAGYPDNYLMNYWDEENDCVKPDTKNELGDTLALFIVREIKDTYDPDNTDVEQLQETMHTIDDAINEMMDVHYELDKSLVKAAAVEAKRLLKETKHA